MKTLIGVVLLLAGVVPGISSRKEVEHPDYVPDEKTAERIAEVVLVSQFGQERVRAQLPLKAKSTSRGQWLVQGTGLEPKVQGGNFGVWIEKHSGCLKVIEHMK